VPLAFPLNPAKWSFERLWFFFVSVEAIRQVLTEPRLTLLHTIHPRSIAELAKLAGRDFKNVVLSVPYRRIQFEIAIKQFD
jgi:predicted transcriptional regulator